MTIKSFKINYSNIGGSDDQKWQRAATLNDGSSHRNNSRQGSKKWRRLAELASNFSSSQTYSKAQDLDRNNRRQGSKKGRSLEDLAENFSSSQTYSRAQDLGIDSGSSFRNDNRKVSSNECSDSNFNRNNIDVFF